MPSREDRDDDLKSDAEILDEIAALMEECQRSSSFPSLKKSFKKDKKQPRSLEDASAWAQRKRRRVEETKIGLLAPKPYIALPTFFAGKRQSLARPAIQRLLRIYADPSLPSPIIHNRFMSTGELYRVFLEGHEAYQLLYRGDHRIINEYKDYFGQILKGSCHVDYGIADGKKIRDLYNFIGGARVPQKLIGVDFDPEPLEMIDLHVVRPYNEPQIDVTKVIGDMRDPAFMRAKLKVSIDAAREECTSRHVVHSLLGFAGGNFTDQQHAIALANIAYCMGPKDILLYSANMTASASFDLTPAERAAEIDLMRKAYVPKGFDLVGLAVFDSSLQDADVSGYGMSPKDKIIADFNEASGAFERGIKLAQPTDLHFWHDGRRQSVRVEYVDFPHSRVRPLGWHAEMFQRNGLMIEHALQDPYTPLRTAIFACRPAPHLKRYDGLEHRPAA